MLLLQATTTPTIPPTTLLLASGIQSSCYHRERWINNRRACLAAASLGHEWTPRLPFLERPGKQRPQTPRGARALARPVRCVGPDTIGHRNRGRKNSAIPAGRPARAMRFASQVSWGFLGLPGGAPG
eukprot:6870330-Pyramimonas_sp.AAC.1